MSNFNKVEEYGTQFAKPGPSTWPHSPYHKEGFCASVVLDRTIGTESRTPEGVFSFSDGQIFGRRNTKMGEHNRQAVRVDPRISEGLAGEVVNTLLRLEYIDGLGCTGVWKCHGSPKVSLSPRWEPGQNFQILVTDAERGKRGIVVRTKRTGVTRRLLGRALKREGVHVEGL